MLPLHLRDLGLRESRPRRGLTRQLVKALRDLGIDVEFSIRHGRRRATVRRFRYRNDRIRRPTDERQEHRRSAEPEWPLIAIVALPSDRRAAVMARVNDVADTIRRAEPGQHVIMGMDGSRAAETTIAGEFVVEELPAVPPSEM